MAPPVLDAHALLVFFERESGFEKVLRWMNQAIAESARLPMSVVNVGEVLYIVRREQGAEAADNIDVLIRTLPIEIVDVDLGVTREAARLKARGGISYADCFAAALAHREGRPLLTGDPEFKTVADLIEIEWV